MIFKVERTSDCWDDPAVNENLNTLEELLEFVLYAEHPVIISYERDLETWKLEIYDDWRE